MQSDKAAKLTKGRENGSIRKERNKYKRLYFKYVENRDKVKNTDDQQNDMQNNNELNTQNNLDFNDFSTEDDDDTDFFQNSDEYDYYEEEDNSECFEEDNEIESDLILDVQSLPKFFILNFSILYFFRK